MKGFFWNSIGLSDLAKYHYIRKAIKENSLNFVAVMETEKQDMSGTNLNRLRGRGGYFIWHCLPRRGRSGGILLVVNAREYDLPLIVEGEFYIKFHLCNKSDFSGSIWSSIRGFQITFSGRTSLCMQAEPASYFYRWGLQYYEE